jgi:hypothetical protein
MLVLVFSQVLAVFNIIYQSYKLYFTLDTMKVPQLIVDNASVIWSYLGLLLQVRDINPQLTSFDKSTDSFLFSNQP